MMMMMMMFTMTPKVGSWDGLLSTLGNQPWQWEIAHGYG